jgi:adenosine deaminase
VSFDVTKKEKLRSLSFIESELTDLHIHVGASVAPHIMWSIAHQQGLRLPVRNYWEFLDLITVSSDKVHSVDDYLQILHKVTEKIQSSPSAMERCVYEIIGKEYRGSNVTQIELRFNPMKRNLGGERDLDHIIHASLRGMEQACLEYSCSAGIIVCLAREFTYDLNAILVEKAIRYRDRGVVAIDIAGPEAKPLEKDPALIERYASLFQRARDAGLRVTIHTGETPHTGPDGVAAVVRKLKPDRIGHGVQAHHSVETMKLLREENITLEVCPSSNLWCKTVDSLDHLRGVLRAFLENRVPFTINTDGTHLLKTNLLQELKLLHENKILSEGEINAAIARSREACFIGK